MSAFLNEMHLSQLETYAIDAFAEDVLESL